MLGSGVVGLTEVTVDTGGRGGVDDTTVLLLAHVGPCGLGTGVRAGDVNSGDLVPFLVGHGLETAGIGKVRK